MSTCSRTIHSSRAGRPAPGPTHRLFRNDLVEQASRWRSPTSRRPAGWAARHTAWASPPATTTTTATWTCTSPPSGPNTLYRNNGNGTFTDVTADAGVGDDHWSTAATFFDYDRDGDLDLFVANYLDFSVTANKQCFDPAGTRDYCGPRSYRPVPDRLFRNEGDGRFVDVSEAAGITKADGGGLGVSTGDYNGDGWLDLFVANDATPNQLWINQKDGTFADDGPLAGVALNAAGNPEGSMGVASGDYDRDGDEDLFITNIIAETFALYANDGKAGFYRRAGGLRARAPHRRLHRLRHRLDRLRQRRLARSLHHQRRRQHRRGAARAESAVSHARPAVPQSRPAAASRRCRRRQPVRRSPGRRSVAARPSAIWTTTATPTSW